MIAIYRSRIFLLEAGNSFGLAGDYFESLGLTVHRVSIKPGKAISLAPFGDSHLLMQENRMNSLSVKTPCRILMTMRTRMKNVMCWVRWRLQHV